MGGFLEAPIILFMVVVAPLWLVLHYRSKKQLSEGMDQQSAERLADLAEQAEQMTERIRVLEQLLDDEVPQWRDQR